MPLDTANLVEIFSSVQGEGIHVGSTTLFVRFGGCDLRCRWCDSPHTWQPTDACRIEVSRGSGRFRDLPNPVPLAAAVDAAEQLELSTHRFVSLTGGEPLLQPAAAAALAQRLRARGPRIHLETHGVATEALADVVGAVDIVSMDWKLASDVRREGQPFHSPGEPFHAEHERFLRAARAAPEVVVKVVITPASADAELDEMCERIAAVDAGIPLVVQPVTPFGPVQEAPGAARLLALVARLSRRLEDVRLVPQTHKSVGVL